MAQRSPATVWRLSLIAQHLYHAFVRVECYSGRKGDERPVRFELNGRGYIVEEVLDQWYGPEDTFFKVRAGDGNLYVLRHTPATDSWSLESFRQA